MPHWFPDNISRNVGRSRTVTFSLGAKVQRKHQYVLVLSPNRKVVSTTMLLFKSVGSQTEGTVTSRTSDQQNASSLLPEPGVHEFSEAVRVQPVLFSLYPKLRSNDKFGFGRDEL
jgi:hypothetical protein